MTKCWALPTQAILCLLLSLWMVTPVHAHPMDTASISLKETAPGRFLLHFKSGSQALQKQLVAPALFPPPCKVEGAYVDCGPSGLKGTIEFPWLEGTLMRLMVDIEWHDGSHLLRVVTASSPSISVYGLSASGWAAFLPVVKDYGRLGVEHILSGFDHLCFVIALALLVRRRRLLVATITAFTLAHSLTLASTALGLVEVPIAPVEAMIALSIVLVCAECLRPTKSLTRRAPWLVAFSFGLLHGFGFASALLEIGIPEKHLPSALFGFNLGVELGQLAVIGIFLGARALVKRWKPSMNEIDASLVYAMGSIAAFWSIDRILAVLGG